MPKIIEVSRNHEIPVIPQSLEPFYFGQQQNIKLEAAKKEPGKDRGVEVLGRSAEVRQRKDGARDYIGPIPKMN